MENFLFKAETYRILGFCMEVHNNLGHGFLEIVYKDALVIEFEKNQIAFQREKEYLVNYKGIKLPHRFYAEFIVSDQIILQIKGVSSNHPEHIAQCINYLKVSKNEIALLVNFGEPKLTFKRLRL